MSDSAAVPTKQRDPWTRPFTGFYRPTEGGVSTLGPVTRFLYAARSVILVISAQAAIIAALLAITDRSFDPVAFVLVFIGLVVAHAISNLSNDYFGHRRGHDTEDSPRLRYTVHPIANGGLDARTLLTGLGILCAVGVAIAVYFALTAGPWALFFIGAGVVLLFLYDAAPITLKSIGLGEIASFLVWGPLMVAGGYYVMSDDRLSGSVFLASVPYGLGVMSILVGKHIDQREFDSAHGQRTLPVLLGEATARQLDRIAVVGMYVVVAVGILLGWLTPFALLVLLAAPRGLRAVSVMARPSPAQPPAGYVGWPLWYHRVCLVHNRLFGWTYIGGLALGAIFPGLRLR